MPDAAALGIERRALLRAGCAVALSCALRVRADEPRAELPPEALAPPQKGDVLVYAFGSRLGSADRRSPMSRRSAKQITAFPMDPATRRVRDGTRLNQLIVVRLSPDCAVGRDASPRCRRGGRVLGRLHAHRLRRHRLARAGAALQVPVPRIGIRPGRRGARRVGSRTMAARGAAAADRRAVCSRSRGRSSARSVSSSRARRQASSRLREENS